MDLKVEEIQSDHHPTPPGNHQASPAHPSPGPSTCPTKCPDHPTLPSTASVLSPQPSMANASQPPMALPSPPLFAANSSLRRPPVPDPRPHTPEPAHKRHITVKVFREIKTGRTTTIICTRTNAPKYILKSHSLNYGRNFEYCIQCREYQWS